MIKRVVVVVGIIKKDASFLIAQRPPHQVMPGYWEFPGGKVEANESQKAALFRELDEELGIHVLTAQFLTQFINSYPDRIVELNIWEILQYQGTPHGKETQEIRWILANQFNDFTFLPSNEKLLAFLKNRS